MIGEGPSVTALAIGIFAALNGIAYLLIFSFVEESRKICLEELSMIYAADKTEFMRYNWQVILPWAIQKGLGRNVRLRPFYKNEVEMVGVDRGVDSLDGRGATAQGQIDSDHE